MGKTPRDSEDALLKKITVANYRQDPYYDPIVKAVEGLLREKGFVAPLELFVRMDLLSAESVENWRRGRIPYLERVIRCNLSKASRILRILRMHAHDLDLKPSLTVYKRWTKGSRPLLRFSKTGDHNVEDAYARHFVSPRKGSGAGVKEVLVDSAGTHTTGTSRARQIISPARNQGWFRPRQPHARLKGAIQTAGGFIYIAPDVRYHKQPMRIAAHEPRSINNHGPLGFNGEAVKVR